VTKNDSGSAEKWTSVSLWCEVCGIDSFGQDLSDIAHHVMKRMLKPHALSKPASYDVVSDIHVIQRILNPRSLS
jgi:hypothetical protein